MSRMALRIRKALVIGTVKDFSEGETQESSLISLVHSRAQKSSCRRSRNGNKGLRCRITYWERQKGVIAVTIQVGGLLKFKRQL